VCPAWSPHSGHARGSRLDSGDRRQGGWDDEGRSPGKKDGGTAHQWGLFTDEGSDGAAWRRFFEGDGTPVSFSDGGGVLQHGGVKGGEGGRSIEEEEGRRVGSPKEDGTIGAVLLRPNSGEGRGSKCSSTIWTWLRC
jgi:hypothetical protein